MAIMKNPPNMNASRSCIACGEPMQNYIDAISDDRYGCPGSYSIYRCHSCGQMATFPPLNESDLPELYSKYYPRREVDFRSLDAEARKVLAPGARFRRWLTGTDNQGHYRARPGQKVLDIGSGSCLALLELRAMGVVAYGVEADPNVDRIAKHFGLQVHIGSIHDNPFPEAKFDLIILNQVIEHVPDPLNLLKVVKGRLNEGGRVILSFPNTDSLYAMRSGNRWINWHVPYHQHHFNRNSFEKLARHAGFSVASARTVTPNLWTLLQWQANREIPHEGQASSTWSNSSTTLESKASFGLKIKRKLISRAARLGIALSSIFNRVIDISGKGDSLLVELRSATEK